MDQSTGTILLIEDSEDDVFIFQRAARQARLSNRVHVANDAEAAMAYLEGGGEFADRSAHPLPFLAFLDLKLPRISGLELLDWIRAQRDLDAISVVALTSSAEERDVLEAYKRGARSYIVKPPTAESISAILHALRLSAGTALQRLYVPGETT